MIEQLFAGSREGDPAAQSIEKPQPKLILERLDRVTDRGLREMKFTGREREAAQA